MPLPEVIQAQPSRGAAPALLAEQTRHGFPDQGVQ